MIILLIKLITSLYKYKSINIYHLRRIFLPKCTFCPKLWTL